MTQTTDVTLYLLVDEESRVVGGAPTEEGARKQAEDMAIRTDGAVYVFQKLGRVVPARVARWEGPGN